MSVEVKLMLAKDAIDLMTALNTLAEWHATHARFRVPVNRDDTDAIHFHITSGETCRKAVEFIQQELTARAFGGGQRT